MMCVLIDENSGDLGIVEHAGPFSGGELGGED